MKEGRLVMLRDKEQFLTDDLEKIYLNYMQEAVMFNDTTTKL
jgi:ABC-2 type transport system ATP-binding protein